MTYRYDHLHLRSRDAVSAASFYVETFGAREVRREGAPAVSRVVLDLGGLTVFIEQAPAGTAPTAQAPHLGIEHLGLGCADLDAALADMRARGVRILADAQQRHPGLRVAFVAGPDDVRIELLERRDAAS
ncbi:VOC family protein [uncultured Methylobacterium sp.]|uniref:VOC family protein n=1 Tax=uncultured Methylobacterium sp. TaxID=157278 RepID=UPI0035C95383